MACLNSNPPVSVSKAAAIKNRGSNKGLCIRIVRRIRQTGMIMPRMIFPLRWTRKRDKDSWEAALPRPALSIKAYKDAAWKSSKPAVVPPRPCSVAGPMLEWV